MLQHQIGQDHRRRGSHPGSTGIPHCLGFPAAYLWRDGEEAVVFFNMTPATWMATDGVQRFLDVQVGSQSVGGETGLGLHCNKLTGNKIRSGDMVLEFYLYSGARPKRPAKLEALGNSISETALCQLGKTAPNPVLSTIRYFRDEYEAHINHKKCPAKVCRPLLTYRVDPEKCTGCMVCFKNCPVKAITGERKKPHLINQDICTKCGVCFSKCKFESILVS